ncbi:Mte1p NDAI_0D04070 [Naumovozyma dairenensis CBS 421]|uniref:5'-3' DNA helicase ZGRF1-like N-terminal domain-containing protein n=1 Tax=Naumovozyma dairenensis (strain ATCC 10597 / BCRC 20456 / CBS 421 / NBRC 0211 / NRRL Y-12639) TaxID=1071378 RepID=G0WAB0_NAUDC|nr:hypothetical protein NDAI_0D04070 [Naumovozyma dairenensis CBS 421]CCD24721.1 hypothetical protein NDAI_0D04070 [Naumovozyma dairenensis CBS 421]
MPIYGPIKKKHKTWHDGKLKYFEVNNRFILYTEESNIVLASEFVTNSKAVRSFLDPEGFDIEEHQIFARFLIIISDVISDYTREVQTTRVQHPDNTTNVPTTLGMKMTTNDNRNGKLLKTNPTVVKRQLITPISNSKINGFSQNRMKSNESPSPTLALKVNRPFKAPRMITREISSQQLFNRPSKRDLSTNIIDVRHGPETGTQVSPTEPIKNNSIRQTVRQEKPHVLTQMPTKKTTMVRRFQLERVNSIGNKRRTKIVHTGISI